MRHYQSFDSRLTRNQPNLPDRELFHELVDQVWDRNWLTNDGPLVRQLEMELGLMTGAEHVIAVASGTLGLMIAARALGIDGNFVCPSFTFVATIHALRWQGGSPTFYDIAPGTFNLDPGEISADLFVGCGIVATQVFGTPLDPELGEIADKFGVPFLVDSAHALGCDLPIIGDAEVLSLHATKVAHSIEGGAILTNSSDVARKCRLMRNFGFSGYDNVVSEGINAKLSELHAAMGLLSLRNLNAQISHNKEEYLEYEKILRDIPQVNLCGTGENYHYVPITVEDRDALAGHLLSKGILARKYFSPGCHRCEPYRSLYPDLSLPHTEELCKEILVLPNHSAGKVCSVIRGYFSQ